MKPKRIILVLFLVALVTPLSDATLVVNSEYHHAVAGSSTLAMAYSGGYLYALVDYVSSDSQILKIDATTMSLVDTLSIGDTNTERLILSGNSLYFFRFSTAVELCKVDLLTFTLSVPFQSDMGADVIKVQDAVLESGNIYFTVACSNDTLVLEQLSISSMSLVGETNGQTGAVITDQDSNGGFLAVSGDLLYVSDNVGNPNWNIWRYTIPDFTLSGCVASCYDTDLEVYNMTDDLTTYDFGSYQAGSFISGQYPMCLLTNNNHLYVFCVGDSTYASANILDLDVSNGKLSNTFNVTETVNYEQSAIISGDHLYVGVWSDSPNWAEPTQLWDIQLSTWTLSQTLNFTAPLKQYGGVLALSPDAIFITEDDGTNIAKISQQVAPTPETTSSFPRGEPTIDASGYYYVVNVTVTVDGVRTANANVTLGQINIETDASGTALIQTPGGHLRLSVFYGNLTYAEDVQINYNQDFLVELHNPHPSKCQLNWLWLLLLLIILVVIAVIYKLKRR